MKNDIQDIIKAFQTISPLIQREESALQIDPMGFFFDEWGIYFGLRDKSFTDYRSLDALDAAADGIPWGEMAERFVSESFPDFFGNYSMMATTYNKFLAFCLFSILLKKALFPKMALRTRVYRNKWDARGDWEPMGGDNSMIYWIVDDENPYGAIEHWGRKKKLISFKNDVWKALPELAKKERALAKTDEKYNVSKIIRQGVSKVYEKPDWVESDRFGKMFAVLSKYTSWNMTAADVPISKLGKGFWESWDTAGSYFECMVREVCLSEEFLLQRTGKSDVKLPESFRSANSLLSFGRVTAGAWPKEFSDNVLNKVGPKVMRKTGFLVVSYGSAHKNKGLPEIECFCMFYGDDAFRKVVLHPSDPASSFFCREKFSDTVMRELKKASVLPDRIDGEKCWELTRNEMYGLGELEESYTEYEDDPTGDGDATPEEQWKLWDFCARYDEQIERMKRAETVTGDKLEQYRTTLRHCDCPDFEKNRRPCKHMYSLAMSLGIQARPEQEEPRRKKRKCSEERS